MYVIVCIYICHCVELTYLCYTYSLYIPHNYDRRWQVVIKVSDEGGGIKRSNLKKVWSYLFTTASPSILHNLLKAADEGSTVR